MNPFFVGRSKYDEMHIRAVAAEGATRVAMAQTRVEIAKHEQTLVMWNSLVGRINSLGGEAFLQKATIHPPAPQFTADDVQRLIMLCHPDKHDGKPIATEMTQKLLKLKESIR